MIDTKNTQFFFFKIKIWLNIQLSKQLNPHLGWPLKQDVHQLNHPACNTQNNIL